LNALARSRFMLNSSRLSGLPVAASCVGSGDSEAYTRSCSSIAAISYITFLLR